MAVAATGAAVLLAGTGFWRWIAARRRGPDINMEFDKSDADIDAVWMRVRSEAAKVVHDEPELECRMKNAVLRQSSLEDSLAHILSNKLSSVNNKPSLLYRVLRKVLRDRKSVEAGTTLSSHIRDDLMAVIDRDEACFGPLQVLCFFKGYLSIQAHRISHVLWIQGQKWMALQIQSAVSEKFGVDIHPAATIGRRVMIDHATGVVIGETARVGDDCSLLHNVTLGATGKQSYDRHPKLGSGVLVGAGTMIIGNVYIGNNAKLGAGSLVLKDIPAGATAVGSPAKVIGRSAEAVPGKEMDTGLKRLTSNRESAFDLFALSKPKMDGYVTNHCLHSALKDVMSERDIDRLFFELDDSHTGQVKLEEVKKRLVEAAERCIKSYSEDQYCSRSSFAWKKEDAEMMKAKLLSAIANGKASV